MIASDGHYGQKDTEYVSYFDTLVNRVNEEHKANPFEFCMINGDIVYDDKQYFSPAKDALDKLQLQYYVSQGNHDHATPEEWEAIWKMPLNHDFKVKKNSFLIATTSDQSAPIYAPMYNG